MNFSTMGVANATPNSFSDGGQHFSIDDFSKLLRAFSKCLNCSIIDIGVESTAPFNSPITFLEEKKRLEEIVFPALLKNNQALKEMRLSFDTYRLETFDFISEFCRTHLPGIPVIWNDVSGILEEDIFAKTLKNHKNTYYILGHSFVSSRHLPFHHMNYIKEGQRTVFDEVYKHFKRATSLIKKHGVEGRVFFDPCFGFSKTFEQNKNLLKNLNQLIRRFSREQNWVIGISKKSFLRKMALQDKSGLLEMETQLEIIHALAMMEEVVRSPNYSLIWRVHAPEILNLVRNFFFQSETI